MKALIIISFSFLAAMQLCVAETYVHHYVTKEKALVNESFVFEKGKCIACVLAIWRPGARLPVRNLILYYKGKIVSNANSLHPPKGYLMKKELFDISLMKQGKVIRKWNLKDPRFAIGRGRSVLTKAELEAILHDTTFNKFMKAFAPRQTAPSLLEAMQGMVAKKEGSEYISEVRTGSKKQHVEQTNYFFHDKKCIGAKRSYWNTDRGSDTALVFYDFYFNNELFAIHHSVWNTRFYLKAIDGQHILTPLVNDTILTANGMAHIWRVRGEQVEFCQKVGKLWLRASPERGTPPTLSQAKATMKLKE